MNIRPIGNRVLVKRLPADEVTAGGIYMASMGKEKNNKGVVVAVGKGKKNSDGTLEAIELTIGEKVILPKFGGVDTSVDGVDYVIYSIDEIVGAYA
jgi:chaperonin GroES